MFLTDIITVFSITSELDVSCSKEYYLGEHLVQEKHPLVMTPLLRALTNGLYFQLGIKFKYVLVNSILSIQTKLKNMCVYICIFKMEIEMREKACQEYLSYFPFFTPQKTKLSLNLDNHVKNVLFFSRGLTSFSMKSLFLLGLSLPHPYALF